MSRKILFIVPYPRNTAPSQRLKFEQYYTQFEKEGFEITDIPFVDDRFWKIIYKRGFFITKFVLTVIAWFKRYKLLFIVKKYDVVYVHLWGTPFGFPVYEWLLCKLSKKVIYDIDDLIYKGASSPNNRYISILKSSLKVDFLMKNANHVLVSTDKLLDYANRVTQHVTLIPATIDVSKYNLKDYLQSSTVTIGWSGSHTTSKYLHILDSVLKRISQIKDVKIMIMGDTSFRLEDVNIELIEWSAEKEVSFLQQFDIGIHPLPDEDWIYGKSGGKLVQYLAAGLPIIASAIGPNFKVIKEGYNGFLVLTEDEWFEKLKLLIENKDLRQMMGKNSRQLAVTTYSVEANCNKYLAVFND